MKEFTISKDTPREKGIFDEIQVSKGIEKYYFLAAGLMFLGLICIGAIFFPPYEMGLSIFQGSAGLFFIIVGTVMVFISNLRVKSRKSALRHGEIVEGTIIDHGRKLNPTSSERYFTITIKFQSESGDENFVIKTSDKNTFSELPLQAKTLGILTNLPKYKVFFPAEVGVKLIVKE